MLKLGRFSGFSVLLILLLSGALPDAARADIYKWVDDAGKVHFTDDPYEAERKGVKPAETGEVRKPEDEAPEQAEPAAEVGGADEEKKEEAQRKGSVELVGDIEFKPSAGGRAILSAAIKNGSSLPVRDIWLDVFLFTREGERFDYSVKLTSGKTAPDRLAPGETGIMEQETDLAPEEIFAHKYRLSWREFDIVSPPPGDKELPEGVIHKVIKKSPEKASEGAPQ
ncbi:MAG: DUF4124 domain-containing protein [Candidatus Nitrospinota bacterium M3_3B_026]